MDIHSINKKSESYVRVYYTVYNLIDNAGYQL